MSDKNYSKNFDKGEEMIAVVRRHPLTMAGSFIFLVPIILIDFFFLTWLFAQGWWGIMIFSLVIFVCFYFFLKTYIIWSKNKFVITNMRVIDIDQHGFFHKVVSECNYDKIQDVSYSIKGLFSTIFHFGNIQIQTAGNTANLELRYLKNPEKIQELIIGQQRSFLDHQDVSLTKEEILSAVRKVKRNIDEEEIKKLFQVEE